MDFNNLTNAEIIQLYNKSEFGQGVFKGFPYEVYLSNYKNIMFTLDEREYYSKVFKDIQNDTFDGITLNIVILDKDNPYTKEALLNKSISSNEDPKILNILPKEIRDEYESLLNKNEPSLKKNKNRLR